MSWMIYGANGYTGQLIAREARERALKPILAGRNQTAIEKLAGELRLPSRVFDLDNLESAIDGLTEIDLVLNCAGPFSETASVMMQACLQTKTHYLDITGEIEVFELAHSLHGAAKKKRLVFCPGVGFDVIPTDCVASKLKELMPEAIRLTLGFDSQGGMSSGTAKTTVEGVKFGGRVRQNGEIKPVPLGYRTRDINFGNGSKLAVTIPWGDVSTAYHSTGISNIEVYTPTSVRALRVLKAANFAKPILGMNLVQDVLKRQAAKVSGPSQAERQKTPAYIWGEVENEQGDKVVVRLKTVNTYEVTVQGALAAVCHTLMNRGLAGGYFTPSLLLGTDFIERLKGCSQMYVFED